MSQSVEEPSAAIVSSEQKKHKTPSDNPRAKVAEFQVATEKDSRQPALVDEPEKKIRLATEDDPYVKRFDEHQQGLREQLVKVVTLFPEFEIPVADDYSPSLYGEPWFYWKDKDVMMRLVDDLPFVIEMDIERNYPLRFKDLREAIQKLAGLLDTPKCSYRLHSSGQEDE